MLRRFAALFRDFRGEKAAFSPSSERKLLRIDPARRREDLCESSRQNYPLKSSSKLLKAVYVSVAPWMGAFSLLGRCILKWRR
eukprot:scaffold359_cov351-Pinguiococcus_pyrenoidosus.AAC.8